MMSGSALNFNTYHVGDHRCLMRSIAKNQSLTLNTIDDIIAFSQNAPASVIQNFIEENVSIDKPIAMSWAPIIESL